MTVKEMEEMFTQKEKCSWIVKIHRSRTMAFSAIRRSLRKTPPIAQRRISWIGKQTVSFWRKDKRLGRKVEVRCSLEELYRPLAQQIPEWYQYGVRNFGLFAPRPLGQTLAAVFTI